MMYKCAECGEPCLVDKIDDSFDHEYGTEVVICYASSCCSARILDYYTDKEVNQAQLGDG